MGLRLKSMGTYCKHGVGIKVVESLY